MNAKKKIQASGLGELSDLSGLLAPVTANTRPVELPIAEIDEDPNQPRKDDNPGFSRESIAELAATIKLRGVKSPISVRETDGRRYTINHGARRYRAAMVAGLSTIPAFVDNDYNEADQVIENLQRDNLTPREIADFIGRELARGKKKVQIAGSIGKSPAYITQHITLLDLPEPIALAFNNGRVGDVTLVNELVALHKKMPEQVGAWLADDSLELTRRTLKELSQGTLKKIQKESESIPEETSIPEESVEEGIPFEEDAISLEDALESQDDLNPFLQRLEDGTFVGKVTVDDRVDAVRSFSAVECGAALAQPDLQKTVRAAIERRIRELEKKKTKDVTPGGKQDADEAPSTRHEEKIAISIEIDRNQASVLATFCEQAKHNMGEHLQAALDILGRAISSCLRQPKKL